MAPAPAILPPVTAGTSFVALLRGINVGGHRKVAMADLRALLTRLGFADAQSLLQSGNLVFSATVRESAALEGLLEAEAEKSLGLKTEFLVRSAAEWAAIVKRNPFPAEASRDPGHLVVFLLKDGPKAAQVDALEGAITGPERIRADGRQLYAVYPDGMGRSRLTIGLIERRLATRATARNWNTVLKLAALGRSA